MAYSYQHKKDTSNISGATSAAYSLPGGAIEGDGGAYTVTVTNSNGGLSRTFGPVTLAVTGDSSLTITADDTTPVAGVYVNFRSDALEHGTGTVSSYSWDFGDGTVPSTDAEPSHYFVGNGSTYTVTLTVTYDDDSTLSDTLVITPTAPSATSGQTVSKRLTLSETLNSSTYNTTYDFDYWNGSGAATSMPVGGKLAATAGVGYHGSSSSMNWAACWNIGIPNSNGIIHQFGMWVYIESYGTDMISLVHSQNIAAGQWERLGINENGYVEYLNPFNSASIKFSEYAVPLREWFWFGWAWNAGASRWLLHFLDGTEETGDISIGNYFGNAQRAGVGCFNTAGNTAHTFRVSMPTMHTLSSLDDMGYPSEVVPPQSGNHIYKVNPDSGSDTNDGVSGAWKTVAKTNAMLAQNGIITEYTSGSNGSGPQLEIDTRTASLDVGSSGLRLYRDGLWVRPPLGYVLGTDYFEVKAYKTIGTGEWSATGGYTDIYEIACTEPVNIAVWGDDVYFEQCASLAALDAASGGASFMDTSGSKLYVKTLGLTNPAVDGITYIHSRQRPIYGGDPVGYPAIALAAKSIRVTAPHVVKTACNNGGSYCIGDYTGYAEGALVEGAYCVDTDKHAICWTINATDSTYTLRDSYVARGLNQLLTSYMSSGSGNVHNYVRVETGAALLLARSATGTTPLHGNGTGVMYCHGGYGVFSQVNYTDCTFLGNCTMEAIALATTFDGGTYEHIRTWTIPTTITAGTVLNSPPSCADLTADGITINFTSGSYGLSKDIGGSLTNSTIDCRGHGAVVAGIWTISGTLTFTGNTVQFAVGTSSPVFGDCADGDFVASDNNTYYLPSGSTLWDDYNPGAGAADYTFAGVQGLGYEANSTRLDPV